MGRLLQFIGGPGPAKYIILILIMTILAAILEPLAPDSEWYLTIAKNLYEKGIYSYDGLSPTRIRQPLYPLFLVLFYFLPGQKLISVIIAQMALSVISLFLIFRMARLIYQNNSPPLLVFFLLGHLFIWANSVFILTECLFTFLTICSTYFLVKQQHNEALWPSIWGGVCAGLAFLVRPVGIGPILILLVCGGLLFRKRPTPLCPWLVITLAILVVIFPWTIRNEREFHKFTPFSTDASFHIYNATLPDSVFRENGYLGFNPKANPERVSDSLNLMRTALDNLGANPLSFMLRGVMKNMAAWGNFPGTRDLSPGVIKLLTIILQIGLLVLAVIGFLQTPRPDRFILLIPGLGYSLVFMFTYATTRFTIPALPMILILSAKGMQTVSGLFKRKNQSA